MLGAAEDHHDLEKVNVHHHNGKGNNTTPILCRGLNRPIKSKPLGERKKAVWRQQLMVLLGNTGVLGAGMGVALPSVTLDQLTNEQEPFHLSIEEASWFSAINTMACPLGGLLVGYLLDRIGRKKTIMFNDILGVLGWTLLATCPWHSTRNAIFIQMLIARFISGLMLGLCFSPVGVYSAEISMPKIRGRLILGTSIAIALGILFMYILGYFIRNDWRLIVTISTLYQVISTLCVIRMPESPSWLLQKGQKEGARKALRYFRGLNMKDNDVMPCEEFEQEFRQIEHYTELSRTTAAKESLLQAIRAPEVYKPLLIMTGFFGFQQCSGVVVVIVFAVQISTTADPNTDPFFCAILVGVARLITTFFMGSIFERWGRRPAGMISAFGMTICMMLLAASGWFPDIFRNIPFVPVASIVLHIVFSTMGLLTLPFFMISEVFPQRVRGSASGLSVSLGLLTSFGVIKLFPTMAASMGTANVFAFYGCVSMLAVIYIYLLVPETRGRTLLEIEEYFRSGRRLTNSTLPRNISFSMMEELKVLNNLRDPEQTASILKSDVEAQEAFLKK